MQAWGNEKTEISKDISVFLYICFGRIPAKFPVIQEFNGYILVLAERGDMIGLNAVYYSFSS